MKRSATGIFVSIIFLFSAVMVVLTLLSSIAITRENDRLSTLKNELTALEDENARLLLTTQSEISLEELERTASERLGMLHPDQLKVYYIEMLP